MKKKQKSEPTEYQRKKKRGLALASAYVEAELWERCGRFAASLGVIDGHKVTKSDILKAALINHLDKLFR